MNPSFKKQSFSSAILHTKDKLKEVAEETLCISNNILQKSHIYLTVVLEKTCVRAR